jgi:CofD-related protein of GAK system
MAERARDRTLAAMRRVTLSRTVAVPDPLRLARCERAPELGPRMLFFSGGTALRDVSRALTRYTHNSTHLITPFDSGGSSAKLRAAFGMISVGDLRNRLMALADTRLRGHPEIYRLFASRFPPDGDGDGLWPRLDGMIREDDPLVDAIPNPMRSIICRHLAFFRDRAPRDFDLRGASVGNLILTGGYLNHGRDIDAVTFTFSRLVEVRGLVRPVVDAHCHLRAVLEDGRVVVGQHRITGKEVPALTSPIAGLDLVDARETGRAADVEIDNGTRRFVGEAELICFPVGSFYTSVLACLLPRGIGRAVAEAGCPKVYVPNCAADPEQIGLTVADAVDRLLRCLQRSGPGAPPADRLLDLVIVDPGRGRYAGGLDVAEIERLGPRVLEVPLVTARSAPYIDARRLAEVLVSLV